MKPSQHKVSDTFRLSKNVSDIPCVHMASLIAQSFFFLSQQEGAGFLEKKRFQKKKKKENMYIWPAAAVLTEGRRCLWPLAVFPRV